MFRNAVSQFFSTSCISSDAIPFPSKPTLLFRHLWRYIPMPILSFVQYVPSKEHIRFRSTLKVINKFAKDLINEKTEAVLAGKNENKRDMMSILGTRSPSSLTVDAHEFPAIRLRPQ